MKNKKGSMFAIAAFSIILIILMGAGLYFFGKQANFWAISDIGDICVKPSWARIEFAPTDSYEGHSYHDIPYQGISLWCGQDELTTDCKYYFTFTQCGIACQTTSGQKLYYKICNRDGTSCESEKQMLITKEEIGVYKYVATISKEQKLYVRSDSYTTSGKAKKDYQPWKLYRFVGGSKTIVLSSSNCLIDSLKKNISKEETCPSCFTFEDTCKWINYVDDWNYGPCTNIWDYSGRKVYCTAGSIYELATVTTQDGKIHTVDPTYSSDSSPSYVKSIGSRIKSVECCPSEPGCGTDFKFTSEPPEQECFTDAQCYNIGNPVAADAFHYKKQECKSGVCTWSSLIAVECTSNAACPSGKICDLSLTNYGKCITQQGTGYCGDGICQITETKDTCSKDCLTDTCTAKGGKVVITKSKEGGFFCHVFNIGCTEKTTTTCRIPHLSILGIIFIAIGFIVLILTLIKGIIPYGPIFGLLIIVIGVILSVLAAMGVI